MNPTCFPEDELLTSASDDHQSSPPRVEAVLDVTVEPGRVESNVQDVSSVNWKPRRTSDEILHFPSRSRFVTSLPPRPAASNSWDFVWQDLFFYGALTALGAIMGYLIWKV
ncbi:MAG: hypothetical protein JWP89_4920 [Schlesneria sp.]|nr:hypothetical protein [Schlesneria sp.]